MEKKGKNMAKSKTKNQRKEEFTKAQLILLTQFKAILKNPRKNSQLESIMKTAEEDIQKVTQIEKFSVAEKENTEGINGEEKIDLNKYHNFFYRVSGFLTQLDFLIQTHHAAEDPDKNKVWKLIRSHINQLKKDMILDKHNPKDYASALELD